MEWNDIRFIIYTFLSFLILIFGIIDYNTPDYWVRARWSIIQASISIWLTVEVIDRLAKAREFNLYGYRLCQEAVYNICQLSSNAYIFLVNSGIRSQCDNSLGSLSCGRPLETHAGEHLNAVENLVFEKYKRILLKEGDLEPTLDQLKSVRYFCACSIDNLDRLEYYINCIMQFFPEDSGFFEMYLDHIKDTKVWAAADIKNGKSVWGIVSNVNLLLKLNTAAYRKLLRRTGIKPPRQYTSLDKRRKMPPP